MPQVRRLPFYATSLALVFGVGGAPQVQAQTVPPPVNVVQLSAAATLEVPQDLLAIRMGVTREGADAQAVQAGIKAALDAALTEAKTHVRPSWVDVRTGAFSLQPRFNRDGRITAWIGSAELVLEGRDIARLSALAGKLSGLSVTSVQFGLSREERARVEADAQTQAVERFRAKAKDLARSFGFVDYALREVSVNASDPGFTARPRLMAAASMSSQDSALPVEAGRATVTVNVSGSVQLK